LYLGPNWLSFGVDIGSQSCPNIGGTYGTYLLPTLGVSPSLVSRWREGYRISGVFEDLKFKISEGSDQNWSCPGSALTVIQNWIFGLLMFGGEILLRNKFFAYHWTSYASRISKKCKKAKEIFEGRTKGQIGKKVEFS
jgi:hypothetical protein